MPHALSLSGLKYGKLLVIERSGTRNGHSLWRCQCDCGNIVDVVSGSLRFGLQVSCGCHRAAMATSRMTSHGRSGSQEYTAWNNMWRRCSDPKSAKYHYYGGRGITVCERWQSFANFMSDMGDKPSPKHTLERNDSNGNYEPGNCRWATWTEQQNNKRSNLMVCWNNRTQNAASWERELGWPYHIISKRIQRGWSIEKTMTTSPLSKSK